MVGMGKFAAAGLSRGVGLLSFRIHEICRFVRACLSRDLAGTHGAAFVPQETIETPPMPSKNDHGYPAREVSHLTA